MLGRTWGFDTETVLYRGGGWPYTFQLTNGKDQIYYKNPSLNAQLFRIAFFKTVDKYCADGDVLLSFNLFFENSVLWRDELFLFLKNRIKREYLGGYIRVEGALEDPTPFLNLHFGNRKKVVVIDAAKFFGDGGGNTLEEISKSFTDVPKLKRPGYLGKRKPTGSEEAYFKRYAMVDSIITERLGEVVKKYHVEAQLDEWTFSAAHLAGTYFNKGFCEGQKLDLASGHIEGGSFWARFGGYRQIHAQPGVYRDYAHLDLDSAYPWAMAQMRGYWGGRYVHSYRVPRDGEGIYKIETVLPFDDIRPLFLRRGKNNIELQPLGRTAIFWTSGHEILAYKRVFPKWTYRIREGYEWQAGSSHRRPLALWVKKFHALKHSIPKEDKANKWRRDFAKAMLNHLTGKFDSSIQYSKETWSTPGGLIELAESRPGMLRNYFVAALLRAKVRARIWYESRYGEQFPVEPSIQEMTDSLDVPQSQLHRFKMGDGLGKWGCEHKGDMLFIRGGTYFYLSKKMEVLKKAYHGLAIKNNKTRKYNFAKLLRLILRGKGTYTRLRMVRVREALRMDGLLGTSALKFTHKTFKVAFKNKLREEVKQWLREKAKVPWKSLRSV